MNTSMSNGVSALTAFQKALDVESNNAANVNTTGFKADSVSFSDLMYNRKVGLGVSMLEPIKNFNQGQLKPTGIDYDFAISGEGFFTVVNPENPNAQFYTRAGHFRKNVDNFLINQNDMYVYGNLPTVSGDKITSEFTKSIAKITIDTDTTVSSINTFTTDYKKTAQNTGTSGQNYKTSGSNINDIEALTLAYQRALTAYSIEPSQGEEASKSESTVTFPTQIGANGKYSVEVKINGVKFEQDFQDSIENTLNSLSNKINEYTGVTSSVDTATGVMSISTVVPGQKMTISHAKFNDQSVLTKTVTNESGSGQNLIDSIYNELKNLLEANGAKIATVRTDITKSASGSAPNLNRISLDLDALGISDDKFGDIKNDNGNIYIEQGDARFLIAKLDTVVFRDNSKLKPEGDNLYTKTKDSGDPIYVFDEETKVVNKYLEASNVDLSEELVNLVVFQKAFEANSKSITTSDELLKTALALKNR